MLVLVHASGMAFCVNGRSILLSANVVHYSYFIPLLC